MADTAARTGLDEVIRPFAFAAAFVLSIVASETGHASDWLATWMALLFLATPKPWRPDA